MHTPESAALTPGGTFVSPAEVVGAAGLERHPDGARCPEYRRDYVAASAWVFALLFGPALIALVVLAVVGVI